MSIFLLLLTLLITLFSTPLISEGIDCTARYGGAEGYRFLGKNRVACAFGSTDKNATCTEICREEDSSSECVESGDFKCDKEKESGEARINCICSRNKQSALRSNIYLFSTSAGSDGFPFATTDDDEFIASIYRSQPEVVLGSVDIDAGTDLNLSSNHADVVSVKKITDTFYRLNFIAPGKTTLELRDEGEIVATVPITLTVPEPGQPCCPTAEETDCFTKIVDCSGNCISSDQIAARSGDGVCDDDLSFFSDDISGRTLEYAGNLNCKAFNRDKGDCTSKNRSCRDRFGDVDGYLTCGETRKK